MVDYICETWNNRTDNRILECQSTVSLHIKHITRVSKNDHFSFCKCWENENVIILC